MLHYMYLYHNVLYVLKWHELTQTPYEYFQSYDSLLNARQINENSTLE